MHIYAWVVIAVIGLFFLITGWSPFPPLYGGRKASHDLSGIWIRLMGGCFVLAAVIPIVGYRHIESVLGISILLLLIGFVLLVIGMIRAGSGSAL